MLWSQFCNVNTWRTLVTSCRSRECRRDKDRILAALAKDVKDQSEEFLFAPPPAKSVLKFNPSHDLRAKTRLHMSQKHRVIKVPLVPRRVVGGDEVCGH